MLNFRQGVNRLVLAFPVLDAMLEGLDKTDLRQFGSGFEFPKKTVAGAIQQRQNISALELPAVVAKSQEQLRSSFSLDQGEGFFAEKTVGPASRLP